jgi:gliding motility-associated-like protein
MKKIYFILLFMVCLSRVQAQIPTTCLEVESILVDACGSPEGENEMVRFQVGINPLVLSSMNVSWPNNSWLGLCQNATTASVVSTWNSTVTSCGLLMEPTGGIIPAGKRVILVSSTNVIPGANSFAGLSDTVYVIFQCAGNTSGHFANFGTGLRTLTITVGGCNEIVTYDRALLEDQLGVHIAADGATVAFDWPGTPDYINSGCIAPVTPLVVDAGSDQTGFCSGDTVYLNPNTQGSFSGYNWTGGTGTFINPTSISNPMYIVSASDANPTLLFLTATNCNGSITDTILIYHSSPTPVSITPSGPISMCNGDSVLLTANGTGPFTWNTSETSTSIYVNTPANYTVTQTSACGNSSDTVAVVISGIPPVAVITPSGPASLCPGSSITLQGSGGSSYAWSTSAISTSINVSAAGTYTLIVSNGCGSDTASITLTANPNPQAIISPSSPINLCGGNAQVTVTGTGTFTWNTGTSGSSENYTTPGNYYVVASTTCGTDTAFFTVIPGNVTANFNASPTSGSSPLAVNFTNASLNADTYNWIFGDGGTDNQTDPAYIYNLPGTYVCTLIASNTAGCSDTTTTLIVVDSCSYTIKIPNVFSPDGNGLNDLFYVTATCTDIFNAYIFDRWGVKVFEYNTVSGSWDGTTFTGSTATFGVYSYVIYLKDYNGEVHEYSGFVHLFD